MFFWSSFRSSGRHFYFLLAMVSIAFSACTQSTDNNQNIKTDRLANGLEIVVITDKRAPVITHMVWYKAGGIDDPEGKSGIAHYFEHLMFKGTDTLASGEFSEKIAMMGGSENAFTAHDYTAYFQRISADRLAEVMKLEADRMANLIFVEEEALSERDVVLEARSSRTDSRPTALLGEKLRHVLNKPQP
jgi:zinc protease